MRDDFPAEVRRNLPIKIADVGGRVAAGRFIKGAMYPQVVINSGDGVAPLEWYECRGDPDDPKSWIGHDLVGRDVIHDHSLRVADIDGDGNLDIFAAEMAKWTENRPDPDNPEHRGMSLAPPAPLIPSSAPSGRA